MLFCKSAFLLTMVGDLPPSSNVNGTRFLAASDDTFLAMSVDAV